MTCGFLGTAAIPSSIRSPTQPSTQSGTTLITCSLVLFGVALLASAAQRSLEDGISLTHNAVDRQLAQRAAEAALHDAAMMIAMIPDPLTVEEARGTHRIGEMTGERYAFGGYLQPYVSPEYSLEVVPRPTSVNRAHAGIESSEIYRVTARGKGHGDSTTVILQADFAVQLCKTDSDALQNPAQDSQHGTEKNTEERTEQPGQIAAHSESQSADEEAAPKRAACARRVRRMAWRMLQAS